MKTVADYIVEQIRVEATNFPDSQHLAERSGISYSHLRRFITDEKAKLTAAKFLSLAAALGANAIDLDVELYKSKGFAFTNSRPAASLDFHIKASGLTSGQQDAMLAIFKGDYINAAQICLRLLEGQKRK